MVNCLDQCTTLLLRTADLNEMSYLMTPWIVFGCDWAIPSWMHVPTQSTSKLYWPHPEVVLWYLLYYLWTFPLLWTCAAGSWPKLIICSTRCHVLTKSDFHPNMPHGILPAVDPHSHIYRLWFTFVLICRYQTDPIKSISIFLSPSDANYITYYYLVLHTFQVCHYGTTEYPVPSYRCPAVHTSTSNRMST